MNKSLEIANSAVRALMDPATGRMFPDPSAAFIYDGNDDDPRMKMEPTGSEASNTMSGNLAKEETEPTPAEADKETDVNGNVPQIGPTTAETEPAVSKDVALFLEHFSKTVPKVPSMPRFRLVRLRSVLADIPVLAPKTEYDELVKLLDDAAKDEEKRIESSEKAYESDAKIRFQFRKIMSEKKN